MKLTNELNNEIIILLQQVSGIIDIDSGKIENLVIKQYSKQI